MLVLPKVSIVMPVYNYASYIGESIQCVIDQTYTDWELIIVNDGSTDSTKSEIKQFADKRIKYIYQENKGASKARNVGINSACGEYLAFLDADDYYHPCSLESLVDYLVDNPTTGLVYGLTIEHDQEKNPLKVHQPPAELSQRDLLIGFPLCFGNFMVRRYWLKRIGGLNNYLQVNEDRELLLRLFGTGCKFARVARILLYRRRHAGRKFQNFQEKLADMIAVLDSVFKDSLCPPDILKLAQRAYRNIYIEWALQASISDQISIAHSCYREAMSYDSTITENNLDELLGIIIEVAIRDGGDHEGKLQKIFDTLPENLHSLLEWKDRAVLFGRHLRAVRDSIWGRQEQSWLLIEKAGLLDTRFECLFFWLLRYQLLNYEAGFGPGETKIVIQNLFPILKEIAGRRAARSIVGRYWRDSALRKFNAGKNAYVPAEVIRAVVSDPGNRENWQMITLLYRAVIGG